MSFWTGFATGLAKSVDQGLKKAMDKRDDELSRAKTFWQTRQAQKLDQKEAYDARAEKALRRMINEAGGDATLGLAAFNAAGGDADSVETLIKRIDDTRANKGTYNLLDSLKTADGKPITPGESSIDLDSALKSVRMQMKGIEASNIKIDDPLSKFGLGLRGGASEKVAESVNALIPPETVEQLTGIPQATLDMSNMIDAEKYANDQKIIAKQLTPSLAEGNAAIVQELMSLDPKAEDYNSRREELLEKQKVYIQAMGDEAQAKDTSTTGSVTTATLNTMYTQQLTGHISGKGINTKEQTYLDADGNLQVGGKGYIQALDKAKEEFSDVYVASLQRVDGSFGPAAIGLIENTPSLRAASNRLLGKDGEGKDTSAASDTPPEEDTKPKLTLPEQDQKVRDQYATSEDYTNNIFKSVPVGKSINENAEREIGNDIMRIYNVSQEKALEIINNAKKQKTNDDIQAQIKKAQQEKNKFKTSKDLAEEAEAKKRQRDALKQSEFSFGTDSGA